MLHNDFLAALTLLVGSYSSATMPANVLANASEAKFGAALEHYQRCAVKGRLTGSATAILAQLGPAWIAAFGSYEPESSIALSPPFDPPLGRVNGRLRRFLDGRSDFAFLSRDLATTDRARFVSMHGYQPTRIPVAGGSWRSFGLLDPVAVVVNSANPVRGLSFAQLDALFSKTRLGGHPAAITWGDLGVSEWAEKPIHVIGGASWSGEDSARAMVMRERVLSANGKIGEWRSDLPPTSGSEADVPERVGADPLAIGFTGLGHVKQGTRAVALTVRDGGPFVEPSFREVADARYPLTRTINLLIAWSPGARLDPVAAAFARFLLSHEGQTTVLAEGKFLPLTSAQAVQSRALLGAAGQCEQHSAPEGK